MFSVHKTKMFPRCFSPEFIEAKFTVFDFLTCEIFVVELEALDILNFFWLFCELI